MTDDIPIPLTDAPGICEDCKHLAPRLRMYGKVVICHACTARRQKAARELTPETLRRDPEREKPLKNRRCTDCQAREPDGRNYGTDAYLCLTCENEMLERVGLMPDVRDFDLIRA